MQRFDAFLRAVDRLAEALEAPATGMNRDASIQRFEFCFELGWKVAQALLRREGILTASPRTTLRAAFRLGWLADELSWLAMLDDRNLTSHTYDDGLARAIYARLPGHLTRFRSLTDRLEAVFVEQGEPG